MGTHWYNKIMIDRAAILSAASALIAEGKAIATDEGDYGLHMVVYCPYMRGGLWATLIVCGYTVKCYNASQNTHFDCRETAEVVDFLQVAALAHRIGVQMELSL